MGVGAIGQEATNYVNGKYGKTIDPLLAKIAHMLWELDVTPELAVEIGGLIGDVAGLNFIAGVEFGELYPEAVQKIKDNPVVRLHETQPSGASSSHDE